MQEHDSWLEFAEYDLKAAKRILVGDDPLIYPALVLAQQCAEKSLKGYLYYSGESLSKTHDLVALVKKCAAFDEGFQTLLSAAKDLAPHVTTSRYPDSCLLDPDLSMALSLVQKSEQIYLFVMNRVA